MARVGLKRFLVGLLAVGASATSLDELPDDVRAGYFPSRSAPVIVKPVEHEDVDTLAVLIDKSNSQLVGASNEVDLPLYNVVDVVTRSLGVQPVHPDFAPAFLKADIFSKVKANLYFSVEALGEEFLSNHMMNSLQQLRNTHHSFRLTGHSYPVNHVSLATSLASGVPPSRHGIVGDAWVDAEDVKVVAFDETNARASSRVANWADVLSQSFGGQSLTVSASASPQAAAAYMSHHTVAAQRPDAHDYGFALRGTSFTSLRGNSNIQLDVHNLEALFGSSGLIARFWNSLKPTGGNFQFDAAKHTLTLSLGGQQAVFNLDAEENVDFFGELSFALHLLEKLQTDEALKALVQDDIPDAYSFTFAAIKDIRDKHGEESPLFGVAVRLLDLALPQLMDRYAALYQNSALTEFVMLGSDHHGLDSTVFDAVQEVASTESGLEEHFPSVYVHDRSHVAFVCRALRQKLKPSEAQVLCLDGQHSNLELEQYSLAGVSASASNGSSSGNSSNVITARDIANYQICLWTSVLLVAVVFFVVYSVANMDNRRDTMLYSRFNPNWSDRKRR
eukprot:TRINITY_DN2961_c0_g2_i1.p1 TRINITY_DN2961_c0_g2~~TRINITY_DN2961_c0_g2_i1.p1  ORF type:complete len:561 (+),score=210.15 TRINITY_DN2961_c0_g2_i1:61-1743(+)